VRLPEAAAPVAEAAIFDRVVSRRRVLAQGAFALGGLAAVSSLFQIRAATAAGGAGPKPIPGGFSRSFKPVPKSPAAHVFQPLKGGELSTIGDFRGFVAATEIQGKARGSDGSRHSFDVDMRFMQGQYVDTDGRLRFGTFGFI